MPVNHKLTAEGIGELGVGWWGWGGGYGWRGNGRCWLLDAVGLQLGKKRARECCCKQVDCEEQWRRGGGRTEREGGIERRTEGRGGERDREKERGGVVRATQAEEDSMTVRQDTLS